MVNYLPTLDRTFSALADPVRRAMLTHLSRGEATVSELGAQHGLTLPAVLKHVRYLESAGLLTARKEGRARLCRLAPRPLASAAEWIEHYRAFWENKLDSLERFLIAQRNANLSPGADPSWTQPPKRSSSKSAESFKPRRPKSSPLGRKPNR